MKIWMPTNPVWYVAVFVFFGPFIFEAIFGPSWIIKLLSISVLNIGITVLLFFFALTSRFSSLMEETPFVKKWGKERVLAGMRLFFLAWGLLMSPVALDLTKDIGAVIAGAAPEVRTDMVVQKTSWTGEGGYFVATIRFDSELAKPEGSYYALFFPVRHLQEGGTYEFLVLPNSKLILEAKPVQ